MIWSNEGIRVENRSTCYLCGLPGEILYAGMRDRLFSAPGIWTVRLCRNCQLAWLDPCPLPQEVNTLYLDYYTHYITKSDSLAIKLKQSAKRAVWAAWLGYHQNVGRLLLLVGYIARLCPPLYEAAVMTVMGLSAERRGRLIDIGCGNGQFLALMRCLGWEVLGVDPDVEAARVAENTFGIKVISSTLEEANLPEAIADAITMNHVIEHVSDPLRLLKESKRILKPGGTLVVVTPNLNSLGRYVFGASWRDWDIPRHLFIFSRESLEKCAYQAGLRVNSLRTTARSARWIWATSHVIHTKGRCPNPDRKKFSRGVHFKGWVFQWLEHLFGNGEELMLIATR